MGICASGWTLAVNVSRICSACTNAFYVSGVIQNTHKSKTCDSCNDFADSKQPHCVLYGYQNGLNETDRHLNALQLPDL